MATASSSNFSRQPNAQGIATHQALLVAAGRIFAQRGYEGASLRDIAQQAGTALSAIVYHFATKKKLYFAVIEHYVVAEFRLIEHFRFFEALDYADPQAVADALRDAMRSFLEACHGPDFNPHTMALYKRIMVEADPEVLMPLLACFVPVQELLPKVVARIRPDFSSADIAFWLQLFWSQLQYTVMGRDLILYDMGLGEGYTKAYLDEAAWRFAVYCGLPLGLPAPRE